MFILKHKHVSENADSYHTAAVKRKANYFLGNAIDGTWTHKTTDASLHEGIFGIHWLPFYILTTEISNEDSASFSRGV